MGLTCEFKVASPCGTPLAANKLVLHMTRFVQLKHASLIISRGDVRESSNGAGRVWSSAAGAVCNDEHQVKYRKHGSLITLLKISCSAAARVWGSAVHGNNMVHMRGAYLGSL